MAKTAIRVAVVDDELSVRKALARLLAAASFKPEIYGSAREFIDSLKRHIPNCAVVDIHMPELSGIDLQRHLECTNQKIPTIIITAFDDADIRTQCMSLGAVAFLTKPLHGPTLIETIKEATAASAC